MITERKLKNEITKLKEEIKKELIQEELNIEIKGVYHLYIDELDTNELTKKRYNKIRENLKLKGFELKETKESTINSHITLNTYKWNIEIWEKHLGTQIY